MCVSLGLFDSVYVLLVVCFFFFFKQKTAYEMRISDWSSDVCSSDLAWRCLPKAWVATRCSAPRPARNDLRVPGTGNIRRGVSASQHLMGRACGVNEIGRASCRVRVCQYV